uniref:Uncharacterized protein n=1 Tax=Cajanus cajan TaxID=3821 RepID=A0A151QQF3_CAJCA|nr:hypothetical protein KK1_046757 [Cajanus cajan]
MIVNHYIVVQRRRPFFTIIAKQLASLLPIELYNDRFLWRVSSKLVIMLKIDKLTSIHSRGEFSKICVC